MKRTVTLFIAIIVLSLFCSEAQNIEIADTSYKMVFVEGDDFEIEERLWRLPDFYIGQTEVTYELWSAVMGDGYIFLDEFQPPGNNYPVSGIFPEEIDLFIEKLNKLTKRKYRLPSSIEWQYVFQEGKKNSATICSGSNNADSVAWYKDNSDGKVQMVQQKKPNALGVYDMSGNVSEICRDGFTRDGKHYWFNLGGDYLMDKEDFEQVNGNIRKGILTGSLSVELASPLNGIRLVCDADTVTRYFPTTSISVSENNISIPAEGGSWIIEVSTDGREWEVSYLPDWCKATKSDGGLMFEFTCPPNYSVARNDWFRIRSGYKETVINVNQAAKYAKYLTTDSKIISFKSTDEPQSIVINTDGGEWNVTDLPEWCTVTKSDKSFLLSCSTNKGPERSAKIKITAHPYETVVDVKQASGATYLKTNIERISFSDTGGSEKISVMTDGDTWQVTAPWWCKISKENGCFTATCTSNKYDENTGFIKVNSGNREVRIYVSQRAPVNSPRGEKRLIGLSAGYVNKVWNYTENNSVKKYGVWNGRNHINGVQLGVRVEPLFKYGFGLNTGLFYEYYYSKSKIQTATDNNGSFEFYNTYSEHSLYLPVHLEYRLYFSKDFSLFFYGGMSFDYGLAPLIEEYESGYDEPYFTESKVYENLDFGIDYKGYNASYDVGAGVRIKNAQINAGISRGLVNHSHDDNLKVKQHRNIQVSLSWMLDN